MGDVVNLGPPPGGPQELECLRCASNSFFIFPDAVVTCTECSYIMELKNTGPLIMVPGTND